MTRIDHQSGTDRLAEAAATCLRIRSIVNVQGDEPLIEPEVIDRAVAAARLGDAEMVTLMTTTVRSGLRSQIPIASRSSSTATDLLCIFLVRLFRAAGTTFLHLGLYVYRVGFLKRFTRLERTPLEIAERLEQLRALEHGFRIRVVEVESESWGIDTPADLEKFKSVLGKSQGEGVNG